MSGIFPGRSEGRADSRRLTHAALLSIPILILIILSISTAVSGLDLPEEFRVEIDNTEGDDGDLGYIGSTFEFTVDRPAGIQSDQVGLGIKIDGSTGTMDWNEEKDLWSYSYSSTTTGIFTWEITMTDLANESDHITESGQIAVLEDRGKSETEQSEHEYHNDPMTYLIFSFIMSFASVSILAGAFALKYGKKRSKITAVPMILSGLIIWGHWITFNFILGSIYPDDTVFGIIHWVAAPLLKPLMALLGAVVGAILAVIIFLTVIVRS